MDLNKKCTSRQQATPLNFDYETIPPGYYDHIFYQKNGIRKAWHVLKFQRILEGIPAHCRSILDIGSASGTFLGQINPLQIPIQVGLDISPQQVQYAQKKYGQSFRHFLHLDLLSNEQMSLLPQTQFDVITCIEIIEHLPAEKIRIFFERVYTLLPKGGLFILTTPNYGSFWPLIELFVNLFSHVGYEDQHITRFSFFPFFKQVEKIYPLLHQHFHVRYKTTSHFLMPFTSALAYSWSKKLSSFYPHQQWKMPFGNLIIVALEKK